MKVGLFILLLAVPAFADGYARDYLKSKIPHYPHHSCAEQFANFRVYNQVEVYKDPAVIRYMVDTFAATIRELNPDFIAAPEARALPIFGALGYVTGKPGIFIRKAGKLPRKAPLHSVTYTTAYSTDGMEMTADPALKGKTVVIIDDGISSGGTTLATIHLLEQAGMKVIKVMAPVRYHYRKVDAAYEPWEALTQTLFDF